MMSLKPIALAAIPRRDVFPVVSSSSWVLVIFLRPE